MMSALLPLPVYVQVRMFCHFPANPYKGFSVNFLESDLMYAYIWV